jgi:DNA-binding CsgD family transcriptional regulator
VCDAANVHRMTGLVEPGLPDELVAREAAQALANSTAAVFVIEVPSGVIIAASQTASRLFESFCDGDAVGQRFEDLTSDEPSGALKLFAEGLINGFEATREFARSDGLGPLPVRLWCRHFDDHPAARFALVMMTQTEAEDGGVAGARELETAPIVGTASSRHLIEQISSGTVELFGCGPEQLLGQPVTGLVDPRDGLAWAAAASQVSTGGHAVTLVVRARGRAESDDTDTGSLECDVLLLPLHPGFTFVFMPVSPLLTHPLEVAGVQSMLLRLSRIAGMAHSERQKWSGLSEHELPGLTNLTVRELDMMTRLIAGYRVSSIAEDLVLSPSTVRSHLASIFAKLGVTNQSDLISAVRSSRPSLGWSELHPSWHDEPEI